MATAKERKATLTKLVEVTETVGVTIELSTDEAEALAHLLSQFSCFNRDIFTSLYQEFRRLNVNDNKYYLERDRSAIAYPIRIQLR